MPAKLATPGQPTVRAEAGLVAQCHARGLDAHGHRLPKLDANLEASHADPVETGKLAANLLANRGVTRGAVAVLLACLVLGGPDSEAGGRRRFDEQSAAVTFATAQDAPGRHPKASAEGIPGPPTLFDLVAVRRGLPQRWRASEDNRRAYRRQ